MEALGKADIPVGPVNELGEVFADAQVRDRGMVVSVPHPASSALTLISNPIRFSETPLRRYEPPPMLGQHTDAVLRGLLGINTAEIEALRQQKII